MSVLNANLKHLYQRRMLWFWYLIMLSQVPLVIMPFFSRSGHRYLSFVILSLFGGIVMGGMQKEIFAKPFSFCLPGHRGVPRRVIFWVGGVLNGLLGLVFLAHHGIGFPHVLLVVCAAGFAGMLFYFWGMYLGLVELPSAIAGISMPLIIFGAVFFEGDRVMQDIIIRWPILMIAAGGAGCAWVWKWLGRDSLRRRYCGKVVLGMTDQWDRAKVERYKLDRANRKHSATNVSLMKTTGRFFLAKMNGCDFNSGGRYIWGSIYMVFGRIAAMVRLGGVLGLLGGPLFFLLYFCYMPVARIGGIVYIIPVFLLAWINLFPYRSILLPAGRVEKYYGAIGLVALITVVVGAALLGLTGLSAFLENRLPEITVKGHTLTFHALNIGQFYNYLLFAPLGLLLSLIFPRGLMWRMIFLMVPMQLWLFLEATKHSPISMFGPIGVTSMVVLVWIIFLWSLRYHCMKRCLVGQGKG